MTSSARHTTVVLFLEDDVPTAEALRDFILMEFGESVIGLVAVTVEEAKKLFNKYQAFIQVVMADQRLETDKAEGVEFVLWLRGEANYKGALVAFSGSETSIEKLRKAGCNLAILKPLWPLDFLKLIETYRNAQHC
ncbi:MAG: response regulator [Patescibacteria group bacterium]|jgi:hypothetical protein